MYSQRANSSVKMPVLVFSHSLIAVLAPSHPHNVLAVHCMYKNDTLTWHLVFAKCWSFNKSIKFVIRMSNVSKVSLLQL